MTKFLVTAIIVETLSFALLFVGLFARLTLADPALPVDRVISVYIVQTFPPFLRAVIMLGVLSAGFSTMEGILLSLSTIFSNDCYRHIIPARHAEPEAQKKHLLTVSRIFLVILAPVTFYLSYDQFLHPSLSVAIFAQNGVYGLFSATFIPILFGVFVKDIHRNVIFASSVTALVVHFGMSYGHITMYSNNPGVTGATALLASLAVALTGLLMTRHPERAA